MLKIVVVENEEWTTLRVDGRAIGPWVDELRRACERVLVTGAPLVLDLANLAFVDRGGVALLRGLLGRGVAIRPCSPFVAEQLRAVASC